MTQGVSAGRRDQIFEVFTRHVAARGYDHANLSDIAGELGTSKGTIVHHFGVKAQLMRELEETYMRRQISTLQAIWVQLTSPAERVASMIYASTLLHVVDRDATVATQREVLQLAQDPEMQDIRRLRRQCQSMITDELKRGVAMGAFRPVDVELATLQIFGSLQWMWTWFDPDGPRSWDQVGAAFVDVMLGGLLADRFSLPQLVDREGRVVNAVREVFSAS